MTKKIEDSIKKEIESEIFGGWDICYNAYQGCNSAQDKNTFETECLNKNYCKKSSENYELN